MKINKSNILTFAAIAGITLSSCDNISERDRFIPVDKVDVKKVVLVQEFTGMWCTNCPKGAAAIAQAQEAYPGSVIAVSLHPQNNSLTRPGNGLDLTCAEASVFYQYYKPVGLPSAVVDGVGPNEFYQQWPELVEKALEVSTPVLLDIDTHYDADTREVTVDYKVNFTDNLTESASIMLWVVENGIVGWQIDGARPVLDYTHNHVLRASINGEWGQELGQMFTYDQILNGSASMKLDEKWVAENCEVVAYVFNTGNKYVQQATIKPVIAK